MGSEQPATDMSINFFYKNKKIQKHDTSTFFFCSGKIKRGTIVIFLWKTLFLPPLRRWRNW